ncbi:5-guanidino-2-oxopentanoate decarboxylase [Pararhizobium sp.]|uniref:5-guanidino-2-oxopentanoate decarboxylase n=1 Tax=Pararhizobium sp. TaxID=1977563 RepID=UPI002726B717|nr:5-guanidino-2-oxopentanoate decarboxylase [Pararhizobium sp.]MDO9416254.1 5-guanidino-2-oxopentanoate decarboxylase [Pararhizobium sp.]
MSEALKTVGETLIDLLDVNGVDVVFGIPGVHTVELYRGLAASRIRHITPRHEQGAGFMADGYARVSGKPGVALVITGPGLTNTITAMAQAAQDSIPMLVISGVNRRSSLGHGRGLLHELPDQQAMIKTFARYSHTLLDPADLAHVVDQAFSVLTSGRPGPVHIEIPTDVMGMPVAPPVLRPASVNRPRAAADAVAKAADLCNRAVRPVILAGGGAASADAQVTDLAEKLDAPVVLTVNARGMLANNALHVSASPSLTSVRALIAASDLVIALGTEMGQTDYDMYVDNAFPIIANLVRVDVDAGQLSRGQRAAVSLLSTVEAAAQDLLPLLEHKARDGSERALKTRSAAWADLTPKIRTEITVLDIIRATLPGCIIVGDSTQAIYAGNLYCEIDRPVGWFNAATGFGALGYGPPAAIGAAIAEPLTPVVCLVGDGGFQFSIAEIGSAADAGANVIFLVWNNDGYQEIENYMIECNITPEGVRPSAPDFLRIAEAYGLAGQRLADIAELPDALRAARDSRRPALIEIHQTRTVGATA